MRLRSVLRAPGETGEASEPSGTAGAEVRVEHVAKLYQGRNGTVEALAEVDVTVGAGQFVVLVGPSGCGKTTLLRVIAGLLPATRGRVVAGDRVVIGPDPGTGFVFQQPTLLKWKTVLGNVTLPAAIQHKDRSIAERRARELIEFAGLGGFEDALPSELSGGMQQRVGICRALLNEPQLLLMDEPFAALDALTREAMSLELQRMWLADRQTVVFVTHSIPEAVLLADRVVVMTPRPGKVEAIIDVDLARPRSFADLTGDRGGELVARVRRYFFDDGGSA